MEQVRLEGGPGRGTRMGGDAQGSKQCQGSWHLCVDTEDRKVQVPGEQRREELPPSFSGGSALEAADAPTPSPAVKSVWRLACDPSITLTRSQRVSCQPGPS